MKQKYQNLQQQARPELPSATAKYSSHTHKKRILNKTCNACLRRTDTCTPDWNTHITTRIWAHASVLDVSDITRIATEMHHVQHSCVKTLHSHLHLPANSLATYTWAPHNRTQHSCFSHPKKPTQPGILSRKSRTLRNRCNPKVLSLSSPTLIKTTKS